VEGDEKNPRLAGFSHHGKKILRKRDCVAGDAVLIAPVSKANSPLTGNFTGKFAISGLRDAPLKPKVAAIQRLLGQFPTGVNREDILKNREGFGGYQGIQLLQTPRHQNKLKRRP
jgi:hypothetical protein